MKLKCTWNTCDLNGVDFVSAEVYWYFIVFTLIFKFFPQKVKPFMFVIAGTL